MELLDTLREKAQGLLAAGGAEACLGLAADAAGGVTPRLFRSPAELAGLVVEPKWPLAKLAVQILRGEAAPRRLALLCRGCDERALVELLKRHQIDAGRVTVLGYACSPAQAGACLCERPWPAALAAGEPAAGVDPFADPRVAPLLSGTAPEREARWTTLLGRCLKCYGCRNACPICQCTPCKLEEGLWVEPGAVPAELIPYHLIRAFHLADSCVACGACQEACPAGIPLMALQLALRQGLKRRYGYEAGLAPEANSPLLTRFEEAAPAGLILPAWTTSQGESHGR